MNTDPRYYFGSAAGHVSMSLELESPASAGWVAVRLSIQAMALPRAGFSCAGVSRSGHVSTVCIDGMGKMGVWPLFLKGISRMCRLVDVDSCGELFDESCYLGCQRI